MTLLRRVLTLLLLTPLMAVLLVAVANPRPSLSLRLLTWRSVALPIGAWLGAGAAGGLALGATLAALARTPSRQDRWEPTAPWDDAVSRPREPERQPSRVTAMPQRRAGEPAPTVTVPFRVVQRPSQGQPTMDHDDDWGTPDAADGW